jgi:Na+-translocating ferredoxin:NAD+ oxidoreductase RnfE subunit
MVWLGRILREIDWRLGIVGIGMCFGVLVLGLIRELIGNFYNIEFSLAGDILWYIALVILFCMGLWFSLALWTKKA